MFLFIFLLLYIVPPCNSMPTQRNPAVLAAPTWSHPTSGTTGLFAKLGVINDEIGSFG
jgi:hypothetical protein